MWKIKKNNIFHEHDGINILIYFHASYNCPLCKEEAPNHIKLQMKLLNPDMTLNPYLSIDFIDFYHGLDMVWGYYDKVKNKLVIRNNPENPIDVEKIFKNYFPEVRYIVCGE